MSTAKSSTSAEAGHIPDNNDDNIIADDDKKLAALTEEELERKRKRDETLKKQRDRMDVLFGKKNKKWLGEEKNKEDESMASLLKLTRTMSQMLIWTM
jgi:hypothetical protein